MANEEQLAILEQGVAAWNTWRAQNPSTKADLSGATLAGAILTGADLSRAILEGTDLSGADLHRADLRAARLSGAILHHANLSGANLRYANLPGADLDGVVYDKRTIWPNNFTPPPQAMKATR